MFYIFVMEMDIVLNESREACHFTVWKPHLLPSPHASCAAHAWTLALKCSSLHSVPGYLSRGILTQTHSVQVLKFNILANVQLMSSLNNESHTQLTTRLTSYTYFDWYSDALILLIQLQFY